MSILPTGFTQEADLPSTTTSSVNQLDNEAVDSAIFRCVDDGPSDDRADSISSHHQVVGRRRCKLISNTNECKCIQITQYNVENGI